jgi:hypothetical protein
MKAFLTNINELLTYDDRGSFYFGLGYLLAALGGLVACAMSRELLFTQA